MTCSFSVPGTNKRNHRKQSCFHLILPRYTKNVDTMRKIGIADAIMLDVIIVLKKITESYIVLN